VRDLATRAVNGDCSRSYPIDVDLMHSVDRKDHALGNSTANQLSSRLFVRSKDVDVDIAFRGKTTVSKANDRDIFSIRRCESGSLLLAAKAAGYIQKQRRGTDAKENDECDRSTNKKRGSFSHASQLIRDRSSTTASSRRVVLKLSEVRW
jgi:hypothetical protein